MKDTIRAALIEQRDEAYRAFQLPLIPTVDPERVIGVRTPALRRLARSLRGTPEAEAFLAALPHRYFDEDQLHAFLIAEERDFTRCVTRCDEFLPFVDNWATCDQLSPAVFRRHHDELLPRIRRWIGARGVYTVRFGIGMLMQHFLDADFEPVYLSWVAAVSSEEYYVRMMIAWYFATALAKQYDAALPYFTEKRLDPWTHNKAIGKASESRRIPPERKTYLKSLRLPGKAKRTE